MLFKALVSNLHLKLLTYIKFANILIVNVLPNNYFPMQKREKMVVRMSCEVMLPVKG
jgi:hypothetical protein